MRRSEASIIAHRAARLAVIDCEDVTFEDCYNEYLDQLVNNDDQCLRTWLGWKVENGSREADEILKCLIRSRIAETPAAGTAGESKVTTNILHPYYGRFEEESQDGKVV